MSKLNTHVLYYGWQSWFRVKYSYVLHFVIPLNRWGDTWLHVELHYQPHFNLGSEKTQVVAKFSLTLNHIEPNILCELNLCKHLT